VSSILRALKKLDEDALAREPEGDREINVRQVINRRSVDSRSIKLLILVFLSIVVLGIAAWMFVNPGRKPAVEKKQVAVVQTYHEAESRPVSKPSPTTEPLPRNDAPADKKLVDDTNTQKEQKEPGEKPKRPQLTLNGILWSDIPERRVVLINERYLKEGDVFNGVSVVSIEKNAVVLKFGQETWTLRMNK
jgi:hypothetical protein